MTLKERLKYDEIERLSGLLTTQGWITQADYYESIAFVKAFIRGYRAK